MAKLTVCRLKAYKRRLLNEDLPIRVYRNTRLPGTWYSILQGGRVVGHTQAVMIAEPIFVVSASGRARMLETGHKNVHAYVEGVIVRRAYGISPETGDLPITAEYRPRNRGVFTMQRQDALFNARAACLNQNGLSIYVDN